MKKLFILACMLVLFACGAHAQKGKQAVGFHVGYGTEIESVGVGFKYQYNITNPIRIEPSFDYFFENDRLSMFDINLNAHYLCPITNGVKFYPLAGLTFTNWRWDADADYNLTKNKFGMNLGAGAEFFLDTNWVMNFEFKYQLISDFDQGVFNLGFAYKF